MKTPPWVDWPWIWRSALECLVNFPVPRGSGKEGRLVAALALLVVPHAGPPPGPPSAQGPSLRIDEHLAAADMVRRADEALFLHSLDQPGGIVVADAQLALEVGGRRLLALR